MTIMKMPVHPETHWGWVLWCVDGFLAIFWLNEKFFGLRLTPAPQVHSIPFASKERARERERYTYIYNYIYGTHRYTQYDQYVCIQDGEETLLMQSEWWILLGSLLFLLLFALHHWFLSSRKATIWITLPNWLQVKKLHYGSLWCNRGSPSKIVALLIHGRLKLMDKIIQTKIFCLVIYAGLEHMDIEKF